MKLICVVNDPDASGADVSKLLTTDPALATQVLKLVNSAYFGLMEKVSDVHQAVVLLGMRQIRNIALGASVVRAFGNNAEEARFDPRKFWLHSIAVANLSMKVAQMLPATDPDQAYVVGLLHDMGKLVIHQFRHEEFMAILDRAEKASLAFYDAEPTRIESNHAEVGAWLAQEWELEHSIAEGVRWHHTPEKYAVHRLAGVCRFANYVCAIKFLQCPGSYDAVPLGEPVWEPLELTQADFLRVMNEADQEIAFAKDVLQSIT